MTGSAQSVGLSKSKDLSCSGSHHPPLGYWDPTLLKAAHPLPHQRIRHIQSQDMILDTEVLRCAGIHSHAPAQGPGTYWNSCCMVNYTRARAQLKYRRPERHEGNPQRETGAARSPKELIQWRQMYHSSKAEVSHAWGWPSATNTLPSHMYLTCRRAFQAQIDPFSHLRSSHGHLRLTND